MRRLAHALWLITAALGAVAKAESFADAAPRVERPRYTIEVRLDPERRRAYLRERIRFANGSREPIDALLFHLYPNAFAGTGTVFMREGGTALRGQRLERAGGIELRSLRVDGADILARATRIGPTGDATQLRAPLPAPLAPGLSTEIAIEAELRLPSIVARMGQAERFCMLAQFYPKLAKLEPDGTFASTPYHGLGEFYADFADYELVVELPESYVVAAPGRRFGAERVPGGRRRERYVLQNALDVAFAAAPDLVRVGADARGVELAAYAPAGHARLARAQLALVREALATLTAELGPFLYRRLVVVLPPRAARGAEGMEYPGLIVSQHVGALSELSTLGVAHDFVTAHELAHQWFPIALGTDEVSFPWLDEGIAEWIGTHLIRERYGPRSAWSRLSGLPLEPFALLRGAFLAARDRPSSLLPAPSYRPGQLPPGVYLRPALALESIARAWGRPRLLGALREFVAAQRFAHPRPDQLFQAFDRAYWPGFSATTLRPMLDGAQPTQPLPAHASLLVELPSRPSDAFARTAPRSTLLTRLLTWTQAALGALGP